MVDKKIRLKQQKQDGTYDYLFPATKSDIVDVNGKTLDVVLAETDGKIVENNGNFTAQLAQKAQDVDVRYKNVLIDLNDLTAETLTAIQGGTGSAFNLLSVPKNASVTPEKTTFIHTGKNRFNVNDITIDAFAGKNGNVTASTSYFLTGFIPVEEGEKIISHTKTSQGRFKVSPRFVTAFNENKTVVLEHGSDAQLSEYDVPTGIKYLWLSFSSGTQNQELMIENSTTMSNYEKYKLVLNNSFNVLTETKSHENLTLSTYGDSVTAQGKWQPYLLDVLGFSKHNNYGVGGTRVSDGSGSDTTALCRDERVNQISSESDTILFMGGTNDWAQNVALGSVNDNTTNEFYGAVKTVAEKLSKRFPDKQIVFMTTPYGMFPNRVGWVDVSGYKNNLGLTTGDYGKVIIEVARMFGYPCIDIYGNAGWNKNNISTYVTNDGAYLHPNDLGAKRLATVAIGGLTKVKPID